MEGAPGIAAGGDIDSVNRWILGHLNSIRLGLGLLSDY